MISRSVASEVYPARQDRRPRRRRRRAAARAGARGVEIAHAHAGLSGRACGRSSARETVLHVSGPCLAGRRGCSPARAGGLDLFVLDAPHLYARPGGSLCRVRRPGLARQRAALRGSWSRSPPISGAALVPAFVPDVVHAHDWQAGLAPAYLHYGGTARPATVMTDPQPRLSGHFAGRAARRRSAFRRDAFCDRRRRVFTAASASSRPGCNLPTASPPSRRPMRRDPDATKAAWASTACCAPAPACDRHPQRHRRGRVEPAHDPHLPAPFDAETSADGRAGTRRRCRPGSGLAADRRCPAVRRGQPAVRAEGHRSAARQPLPALAGAGRATRAARLGRAGARAGFRPPRRAASAPGRRRCSAMTRPSRI